MKFYIYKSIKNKQDTWNLYHKKIPSIQFDKFVFDEQEALLIAFSHDKDNHYCRVFREEDDSDGTLKSIYDNFKYEDDPLFNGDNVQEEDGDNLPKNWWKEK